MVESDLEIPQSELSSRLQKLMFLRVLFVSLLLGASIFIQVKESSAYFGDIQTSHYLLIVTIYVLTFVYIILLKYMRDLLPLAYIQLSVDTLFITGVVYTTGGIESIFSFLYILTIINGSIILYRKGGIIIASSSSILYGLLLDLHYYDVIHPFGSRLVYPEEYQSAYIFYIILVNIAAFYLVAFLSSYLSEQARKSKVELKAKQDDIIKLEALNERIIHSITLGLVSLDTRGRIILFNPAAERIFRAPAGKMIGRDVIEALPFLAGHLDRESRIVEKNPKRPQAFLDLPYQLTDGKELFLRPSISPLSLPGGDQKGRIVFFQDITEMKKIEEEMKKVEGLALIGELAAGIAHEIRNPMASISGSIQMLKEDMDKDAVNSRLMDIVLREISRLNHLINDFLVFARPKKAEIERFNLNDLIMDSIELFRNSENWTDKIRVETDFVQSIELESDPEQIRQIFWNLFLNAAEAMSTGGKLQIHAERTFDKTLFSDDKEVIRIVVRDTGKGFSEKALSHLFTPFFTTKDGGSGLGLATVKSLVEGLRGKVYGRNHPQGGAEITIFLHPFPFPSDATS
jgi:two-component system sensor histidine kinase PilS (NtrC family)